MIRTYIRQIANPIRRLRESKAYSQEYMVAKMRIGQKTLTVKSK